MQSLTTSRGPVPNVLPGFIGDTGTLVLRAGQHWYIFSTTWQPEKGMDNVDFIRRFKVSPPPLAAGWWGIVPGLVDKVGCRDRNWMSHEVAGALEQFMIVHSDKYIKPTGHCMEPMNKGKMLREHLDATNIDKYIHRAQPDRVKV